MAAVLFITYPGVVIGSKVLVAKAEIPRPAKPSSSGRRASKSCGQREVALIQDEPPTDPAPCPAADSFMLVLETEIHLTVSIGAPS